MDRLGDLAERKSILDQSLRLDLDGQFRLARPAQLDVAEARQQQEVIAEPLAGPLEQLFVHVAVQRDRDHGELRLKLRDHRFLGLFGQLVPRDRVDRCLEVVDDLVDVLCVAGHGYHDSAEPFADLALDLLDVFEVLDRFLDLEGDPLFHLQRGRSGIRGGDYHLRGARFGEHLPHQGEPAVRPPDQQGEHEHVHQDGVLDTESGQ